MLQHSPASGIRAQVSKLLKILGMRFEVEKFDGTNNFELGQIEIKALLVKHGLEGILEGEKIPAKSDTSEKSEDGLDLSGMCKSGGGARKGYACEGCDRTIEYEKLDRSLARCEPMWRFARRVSHQVQKIR
ncbi:hypothetical protein CRG98_029958 [Punica granatum]|uniref:Uncharacterized protein n=1 Tax=Punica granatum TaxID=22663 RepID=A0A2I0J075_PUNGR|nr:hypothetical protein CRG98_029958 [Punica granatum]